MNESGTDAQMLADQQEKSKNRVTGGTIAVVGGAAVAIGGGALINKFGNKGSTANVVKDVVQTNETSEVQKENINPQENVNSSDTEINQEDSGFVDSPIKKNDEDLNKT
jgi:type VI protein secretion system component VasK